MTAYEIREHARALMRSAEAQLITRRVHPSYNFTKAGIRSTLDQVEGMLLLLAVEEERALHVMALPDPDTKEWRELRRLRAELKEA
jgi:hypothetical protein